MMRADDDALLKRIERLECALRRSRVIVLTAVSLGGLGLLMGQSKPVTPKVVRSPAICCRLGRWYRTLRSWISDGAAPAARRPCVGKTGTGSPRP